LSFSSGCIVAARLVFKQNWERHRPADKQDDAATINPYAKEAMNKSS